MHPYWLVSCGNSQRISARKATAREAMIDCFGIATDTMKAAPFKRKWYTLTNKQQNALFKQVEQEKT